MKIFVYLRSVCTPLQGFQSFRNQSEFFLELNIRALLNFKGTKSLSHPELLFLLDELRHGSIYCRPILVEHRSMM